MSNNLRLLVISHMQPTLRYFDNCRSAVVKSPEKAHRFFHEAGTLVITRIPECCFENGVDVVRSVSNRLLKKSNLVYTVCLYYQAYTMD